MTREYCALEAGVVAHALRTAPNGYLPTNRVGASLKTLYALKRDGLIDQQASVVSHQSIWFIPVRKKGT